MSRAPGASPAGEAAQPEATVQGLQDATAQVQPHQHKQQQRPVACCASLQHAVVRVQQQHGALGVGDAIVAHAAQEHLFEHRAVMGGQLWVEGRATQWHVRHGCCPGTSFQAPSGRGRPAAGEGESM